MFKVLLYSNIHLHYTIFLVHISVDCGSFSNQFYVCSPMLNWQNLYTNECKKATVEIGNPYLRKVQLCTLLQCFLQFYFQYILNASSMKEQRKQISLKFQENLQKDVLGSLSIHYSTYVNFTKNNLFSYILLHNLRWFSTFVWNTSSDLKLFELCIKWFRMKKNAM